MDAQLAGRPVDLNEDLMEEEEARAQQGPELVQGGAGGYDGEDLEGHGEWQRS